MARPLKQSPTIGFRIPVEDYAVLVERAEANGLTIAAYCAQTMSRLCEAYRAKQQTPERKASALDSITNPNRGRGKLTQSQRPIVSRPKAGKA